MLLLRKGEANMTLRKLSVWLKIIIIAMGIAGLLLYFLFVPFVGMDYVRDGVMTDGQALAWLVFLVPTAMPCYLVLLWCWNAACDIGRDLTFTRRNAARLKYVMYAALADTAYLFIGNPVFFFIDASSPSIFAFFAFVDFAGIVIAVAAGCLSHLVYKAALLREENDSFV